MPDGDDGKVKIYLEPDGATTNQFPSDPLLAGGATGSAAVATGAAVMGSGAGTEGGDAFLMLFWQSAEPAARGFVGAIPPGYATVVIIFGALSVVLGTLNIILGYRRKKRYERLSAQVHQMAVEKGLLKNAA